MGAEEITRARAMVSIEFGAAEEITRAMVSIEFGAMTKNCEYLAGTL